MVIEMKTFKAYQPISRCGFMLTGEIVVLARPATALLPVFNYAEPIAGRRLPVVNPALVPQPS